MMTDSVSLPVTGHRTRGVVLVAVCVAGGLLPMSLTGSSVALVSIGRGLGAGLLGQQWVVNAYNVMFACAMLASGALADLLGRRRLFGSGLVLFAAASAASALAQQIVVLDIARGLAGVGAAAVLTAGSAILAQAYDGAARARAFGWLGTAFGAGLVLGPSLGGLLIAASSWQAVFVLNAVIAIAVLATVPWLPESRDHTATGLDWRGAATFTASLFLLTLALVEGAQIGWSAVPVIVMLVACAVMLTGFAVIEMRERRPVFDLSLFAEPRFVVMCLMPVVLAFGFVSLLVILPSYLIGVSGFSSGRAGLAMLLLTGPVLVVPFLSGLAARRVPVRALLSASLLLVAAGAAWLTVISPTVGVAGLIGPMLVTGTGVGIAFGIIDGAAISVVPASRAGMAAGMFNTIRLASEAVAIPAMSAAVVSVASYRLAGAGPALTPYYVGHARALAGKIADGGLSAAAQRVGGAEARAAFLHAAAGSYTSALQLVLWGLAGLCLLSVAVVALLLRYRDATAKEAMASTQPEQETDLAGLVTPQAGLTETG